MNRKLAIIMASVVCALTLALCAGCAPAGSAVNQNPEQVANRAYMSQVNQAMSSLDDKLDAFVEAVSKGDAVGTKTHADRALAALDAIESLEAPEALADVHESYKKGVASLKQALKSYSDLYASGAPVNAEALAPIQQAYDEGVAALEEADKLASEKA